MNSAWEKIVRGSVGSAIILCLGAFVFSRWLVLMRVSSGLLGLAAAAGVRVAASETKEAYFRPFRKAIAAAIVAASLVCFIVARPSDGGQRRFWDFAPATTASCFLLIGMGLFVIERKTRNQLHRYSHFLFSLAALIALGVLIGRFFGATVYLDYGNAKHAVAMSAPAALLIMALAVGGSAVYCDCGIMRTLLNPGITGLMARRMSLVSLLVPLLLGASLLKGAMEGYYHFSYAFTALTLFTIVVMLAATARTAETLLHAENERELIGHEQKMLADASCLLTESLDVEEVLRKIANFVVPTLSDWCLAVIISPEGQAKRVTVAHANPERAAWARDYLSKYPIDLERPHGAGVVLRTGKPDIQLVVREELATELAYDVGMRALFEREGLRSYVCLPLKARNKVCGTISFLTTNESHRYLDQHNLQILESFASRAALAVENATLYEEAKRAVWQRADLLAFASHDLKNPLAGILMSARLLRKSALRQGKPLDEERVLQLIRNIEFAAERMRSLVGDLLDLTKIEAGRFAVNADDCSVVDILHEVPLLFATLAEQNQVKLTTELEPGLPQVRCDRQRVLQVYSNLVGNALKFMRDGGTIKLAARRRGDLIEFSVSDSGPGIPVENLTSIFERYWQKKETAHKGTGLGLAISRGIIDAHGGKIWAESTVGQGSTFYFTLPVSKAKSSLASAA